MTELRRTYHTHVQHATTAMQPKAMAATEPAASADLESVLLLEVEGASVVVVVDATRDVDVDVDVEGSGAVELGKVGGG